MSTTEEHVETTGEEIASAFTHGIGVAMAAAGLAVLVTLAAIKGDAWRVVSFSVYGATLVILYLASTLLHSFHAIADSAWGRFFEHLDYIAIFLLIAGTYTPYMLVTLRGPWGWSLFGVTWGLAVAGIIVRLVLGSGYRRFYAGIYVFMGWTAVIGIKPLMDALPTMGLLWLVLGGLSYTLGVIFFLWRRLPYNHMIWHLFVLGGSTCHFFGILFHVLPMPT